MQDMMTGDILAMQNDSQEEKDRVLPNRKRQGPVFAVGQKLTIQGGSFRVSSIGKRKIILDSLPGTKPGVRDLERSGDKEVERIWREHWRDAVTDPQTGEVSLARIKRELRDFHEVIQRATKVYMHVTGGKLSKLLLNPEVVCSEADEHYQEIFQELQKEEAELAKDRNDNPPEEETCPSEPS